MAPDLGPDTEVKVGNSRLDIPRSVTIEAVPVFHRMPDIFCVSRDNRKRSCTFRFNKQLDIITIELYMSWARSIWVD